MAPDRGGGRAGRAGPGTGAGNSRCGSCRRNRATTTAVRPAPPPGVTWWSSSPAATGTSTPAGRRRFRGRRPTARPVCRWRAAQTLVLPHNDVAAGAGVRRTRRRIACASSRRRRRTWWSRPGGFHAAIRRPTSEHGALISDEVLTGFGSPRLAGLEGVVADLFTFGAGRRHAAGCVGWPGRVDAAAGARARSAGRHPVGTRCPPSPERHPAARRRRGVRAGRPRRAGGWERRQRGPGRGRVALLRGPGTCFRSCPVSCPTAAPPARVWGAGAVADWLAQAQESWRSGVLPRDVDAGVALPPASSRRGSSPPRTMTPRWSEQTGPPARRLRRDLAVD